VRTYKLYATLSNADNLANVTIQRTGRIRSIRWRVDCRTCKTDGQTATVELSTIPSTNIGTSDSRGDIDEFKVNANVGAAGSTLVSMCSQVMMDFPVGVGERLYINSNSTLTAAYVTCYVDVAE